MDITRPIIHFISIINEILKDKSNKLLIHCYEGISRAPALVYAYLIWKSNFDLEKAINFIKGRRKCIDINLEFLTQLRNFIEKKKIFLRLNAIFSKY